MRTVKQTRIVAVPLTQLHSFRLTTKNKALPGAENGILSLRLQNNTNEILKVGEWYTIGTDQTSIDLLETGTEGATEFQFGFAFNAFPTTGWVTIIYTTYKEPCQ